MGYSVGHGTGVHVVHDNGELQLVFTISVSVPHCRGLIGQLINQLINMSTHILIHWMDFK